MLSKYQEVKHGEEFARRHVHVVSEPATSSFSNASRNSVGNYPRDDRIVHNRLIRLVLEIRLVSLNELRSRPLLHLTQFLLSRTVF